MKKAVLIIAPVSFVLFLGLTLLFPACTLCLALLAGAGAGWLAAAWDRPAEPNAAAALGAKAGALSGAGALLGQAVGGVLNALLVGPEGAMQLYESLGLSSLEISDDVTYYAGAIGGQVCCGLVNIGLMAGLGALAAFLVVRYRSQRQPPASLPPV